MNCPCNNKTEQQILKIVRNNLSETSLISLLRFALSLKSKKVSSVNLQNLLGSSMKIEKPRYSVPYLNTEIGSIIDFLFVIESLPFEHLTKFSQNVLICCSF